MDDEATASGWAGFFLGGLASCGRLCGLEGRHGRHRSALAALLRNDGITIIQRRLAQELGVGDHDPPAVAFSPQVPGSDHVSNGAKAKAQLIRDLLPGVKEPWRGRWDFGRADRRARRVGAAVLHLGGHFHGVFLRYGHHDIAADATKWFLGTSSLWVLPDPSGLSLSDPLAKLNRST
jgi:hypothetical protein